MTLVLYMSKVQENSFVYQFAFLEVQEMAERFSLDLDNVPSGSIDSWKTGFEALAAVVLMDQFTRSAYSCCFPFLMLGSVGTVK